MKLGNSLLLYRGEEFNANFYYQSGVDIDHSFFLLDGTRRILLTPKMNYEIARKTFKGKVVAYSDPLKEIKQITKSKALCLDFSSISASLFVRLKEHFKLENVSEQLLRERMIKRADEVAKTQKAVKITKEIFDSIDLSEHKTELDVKKFLLKETLERGLEPAFAPIVATDKNSSFPHYTPANVKLGSIVLVDYGVKYENYCSDLTRCFFLGNDKQTEEAKKNYSKLKEILFDLADNLPNFKDGSELAKHSAKLFEKYKFPKLIHSIGHGVGLDVHEFPRLSEKFKDNLKNSILAIEPAIYLKDYGLRFEETIYFDGKKAKIL